MKRRNVRVIILLACLVIFSCFLCRSVYENFSDTIDENDSSVKNNQEEIEGVYKRQIPIGDEDLYILKSQIVPPVCPACPDIISCGSKEPPPPCPACARCPEPSFDCKKVPNYRSNNTEFLPVPVLTSFSTFGM
jgi:hypothetical protein